MSDIMDRLSEALSDRYRIDSELGEGGMARVFLADDVKHNRRVAIKVLKPELAAVVGRDRFFAEIETTAQLQRPNILPLFDSGEAGGLLFFAMPYCGRRDAGRLAGARASAAPATRRRGRKMKPLRPLVASFFALVAAAGTTSAQERTRGDFDADGVTIHYEIIGDGPAVVLLHGFGASMSGSPMPETILTGVAGRQLIGMDIRGFGISGRPDGPGAYGVETARDVIRLLDHLGIRQADLFGFSMGGIIALKTAAVYPHRIRSLVLGAQGWASLEELQQMGDASAALVSRDTAALSQQESAVVERLGRQAFSGFAAAYPALFVTPDELMQITCPVIAILGSDDERVARAAALREQLPKTQVVIIPGHGHADVVADTLFGQAIARFYRQVDSAQNR